MPTILPLPDVTLQLPPTGEAVKLFVLPSQIAVAKVVFEAATGVLFTVNEISLVVAGQAPLAATVYRTMAVSSDAIVPVL